MGRGALHMNKHNAIHTTILSSLLLCLLACSTDDGKSNQSGGPLVLAEALDVSLNISNFKSEGLFEDVMKDSQEREKFEYSNGCKLEQGVLDKSVRVGDEK